MSVFLTPDLRPFFGGTYFPPADGHGRPGFPRVLQSISQAYSGKREQVERSADEITRMIGAIAEPRRPANPLTVDLSSLEQMLEQSSSDFDSCFGGFGGAPKFPRETLLEALLRYAASPDATEDGQTMRQHVLYTLDCMADGGIRDHLGGGFHRYSTDEKWLVPHFEIMLYDQAMLAVCYTEAWRQTRTARHGRVARGILDFVMREMAHPEGPFYTAFDAEVDAMEGASYLWTAEQAREALSHPKSEINNLKSEINNLESEIKNLKFEIRNLKSDDVDLFLRTYGLQDGPNFADPHHGNGQPDQNILFLPTPLEVVAKKMGIDEEALDARLAPMRKALHAARLQRKQPLLDTKLLTSWNGLMIRALAMAGRVLDEPRYTQAAARAGEWLWKHHRREDGTVIRTSREGSGFRVQGSGNFEEAGKEKLEVGSEKREEGLSVVSGPLSIASGKTATDNGQRTTDNGPLTSRNSQPATRNSSSAIPGSLDDYAFLAQAFLEVHRATGDSAWRDRAGELLEVVKERFADPESGGFYFTAKDATDLIVRQKSSADSPLPSGNAVAALCLLELGQADLARRTLAEFSQQMSDHPDGMSSMIQATLQYLEKYPSFVVSAADEPREDAPPSADELARAAVTLSAEWASATELRIEANIAGGYHLNANRAAQGLIPTTLALAAEMETGDDLEIDYPAGDERQVAFATEPLAVYAGTVAIAVRFAKALPSGVRIRATLTYQPCTDDSCLSATGKVIETIAP